MNLKLGFQYSLSEKGKIVWENSTKLFTTFIVVDRQFSPSWLYSKMGLLPGVIVPVFIEFTCVDHNALQIHAGLIHRSRSIQF